MFAASKRKIADVGPVADNEEVFEVSHTRYQTETAGQLKRELMWVNQDDEPIPDEPESDKGEDDQVNDVTKDKLIKSVKPKGKGKDAQKGKKK